MKCLKCGKEVSDDSKFCSNCGQKLNEIRCEEISNPITDVKKDKKPVLIVVMIGIICAFAIIGIFCFSPKVDTPYDSLKCLNKNYEQVKKDFEVAGFVNISEEVVPDLGINKVQNVGQVTSVSINGISTFGENEKYKKNAQVIITYHTYKNVEFPIPSEEVKTTDTEALINKLTDVGFTNITTEEVYDLDPDTTENEFINYISIDGSSIYSEGEEFPFNTDIKIVTHRPYEKYTLKIIVDFIPNILFNKYDVEVSVDYNTEKLENGKDGVFEYRLKSGNYTIDFCKDGDDSIQGSTEIALTGDTEVSYKIFCYSDKISVETLYLENKSAVGEDEAMIPTSATDFKYEDYNDVEQILKKAGFTNISTKILYDIIWGFTDEGEVEKVSIDGKTDFIRGDIFKKNAKIVITYHMKEEDDPNKPVEKEEVVEEKEAETEEKDESVYYSTNNRKTAQKGNTGVFAYKNKKGEYDVYWIIDFDKGYVYYFTEGNGNEICDKVEIVSGDLNNRVTITWDDDEGAAWYLHFKYVEQPATLIVNDHHGLAIEFMTTDLDKALAVRDTKEIVKY